MVVALVPSTIAEEASAQPKGAGRRFSWRKLRWWRGVVLVLTAVFFLLPLYAALRFALEDNLGHLTTAAFTAIVHETGFLGALYLSLRLAAVTMAITLVLVVPTTIYVHLRYPRLLVAFDAITLLPIGIPPIVLIIGVLQSTPFFLKSSPYLLSLEYVVLATPFAYRSLDAGLRAIDLKTLVEASRSLGSRWFSTMWRVILPNLRAALASAMILSLALVLGEFTMASLDLYTTLPVWIVNASARTAHVSVAVSFLSLVLTWLLLFGLSALDRRQFRKFRVVDEET